MSEQQETTSSSFRMKISLGGWRATVAWLAPTITFFWVLFTNGKFIPVVFWTLLVGVVVFLLMGWLGGSLKFGDAAEYDEEE